MLPGIVLSFTDELVEVALVQIVSQVLHLISGFGRVLGYGLLALLL